MFNFFKKKKKGLVGTYFAHFSKQKKEAIVAILTLIGVIDGTSDKHDLELLYMAYYAKELEVDGSKIGKEVKAKGILDVIQPLLTCTNVEKAILIYVFRGMANIDKVANEFELEIISTISKKLNFDLDRWYSNKASEIELNDVHRFLKQYIFPNDKEDLEEGAGIINYLANQKVAPAIAQELFITVAVAFELDEQWSTKTLKEQISKQSKVTFTDEKIDHLRLYLRSRVIKRLKDGPK